MKKLDVDVHLKKADVKEAIAEFVFKRLQSSNSFSLLESDVYVHSDGAASMRLRVVP